MKSYFAYTRVSTVRQGEHGSSLQEQRAAIEAYAIKHGLKISVWFEEMETAAKQGRAMFNRMLVDIERGRAFGVIIHKIDRSARNLKDWARLGELIDKGIEVHFAHESLDLASRGGRLAADIQAVVAADYVRNLRQEVRKGMYGRVKQGLYPWPAPRGYLNNGPASVKTIDPVIGPLVRQAFDLYASGNYSLPTLRIEMQRRGLTGPSGRLIALERLSQMLHNPFYIGLVRVNRREETFQGIHEPLVPVETFKRVQDLLAGRAFARVRKHDFAFRQLIRCLACRYRVIGETKKGQTYYRCHTPTCKGSSLNEKFVFDDLRRFSALLVVPAEDLRDFRDLADAEKANLVAQAVERRRQLADKRKLCDARLTRLMDAFLDGQIEKELFEQRKSHLLTERREIDEAIGEKPGGSLHEQLLKKLELANTALSKLESEISLEIRELVQMTTSNFELDRKYLVITPKCPFADIIYWWIRHNGGPFTSMNRNGVTLIAAFADSLRPIWLNLEHRRLTILPDTVHDLIEALVALPAIEQ